MLGNLGLANLFLGDLDGAEAALVEVLLRSTWSDDDLAIDEPLLALAAVHALRGDAERAALLCGMAEAHPTPGRHADEQRVWDRLQAELRPAREHAGAGAWERAAARGATLSLRDVVDLVQRRDAAAV